MHYCICMGPCVSPPHSSAQLHPFDSAKYGKIVRALQERGLVQPAQLVAPKEAPLEALLDVHTEDYLHRIHTSSWTIAQARHRGDALSPDS